LRTGKIVKQRNSLFVLFKLFFLEILLSSLWNIFKRIIFQPSLSLGFFACLVLISPRSLDPCGPSMRKGKAEVQRQTSIHPLEWDQPYAALIS